MDISYVCIIMWGTIKKLKTKYIYGGEPSYRAKTVRDWTIIDSDR